MSIREIRAYHPLTNERQVLWEKGSTRPQKPLLSITHDDITKHVEKLPTDGIALHFLSPTRLIFDDHLVKHPSFRVLALRLAERFNALRQAYSVEASGSGTKEASESNRAWYQQIDSWASEVRLVKDETHWEDIQSYSTRQRKTTPIGGLVGRALYAGDLTPLRELLVWGQILHVGKNVVKGNGIYQIEA